MSITNGYATLAEFKSFKEIDSVNVDNDGVIENMIEAVSRYIDHKTGRTFYARTETHYFDLPEGRELALDDDLLTVTTLTNGDGTVLTTAYYNLVPKNNAPYYAIKLKETSTYLWSMNTDGETENVISVAGTWGYASSTPDDIKEICLEITNNLYSRRSGQGADGTTTITGAGVVIQPKDVPGWARDVLNYYKRTI